MDIDADGNYHVNFDTTNIVNTATDFEEVKNLRDVFCIGELNKCLSEDTQIESMGFSINGYSHFSTDTLGKEPYTNPYHFWIIEKRK